MEVIFGWIVVAEVIFLAAVSVFVASVVTSVEGLVICRSTVSPPATVLAISAIT